MLLFTLDEKSDEPVFRQIMDHIRRRIGEGVIVPGDALPSTRTLAEALGIHRSTVATAYQELWSLGYVDLRPGAVPRVRSRTAVAPERTSDAAEFIDWASIATPFASEARNSLERFRIDVLSQKQRDLVSFCRLEVDKRLFPLDTFRTCLNRVLREQSDVLLGYGDAAGYAPLRASIAARLQMHGIRATEREILLTNGSQHAIDLVLRLFARPGTSVAIESPTYGELLTLVGMNGVRPIAIPFLSDGMDLDALERVLEEDRPTLIYTMPNFQNPTGVSTSQAHRERLLGLCERTRTPLLEDGFEEEMKYFGKVTLPIKSMDTHGLVIYCGTFSKVLFPGVRIGWIAAPVEVVERLSALLRFSELSTGAILQATLHDFCERGYYDRHISHMHRVFRKRMQTMLKGLRANIPLERATWTEPVGGYLVWMTLAPTGASQAEIMGAFRASGVAVVPGRYFFSSEQRAVNIRLSIATLDEREIEEGVRRLARALDAIYSDR